MISSTQESEWPVIGNALGCVVVCYRLKSVSICISYIVFNNNSTSDNSPNYTQHRLGQSQSVEHIESPLGDRVAHVMVHSLVTYIPTYSPRIYINKNRVKIHKKSRDRVLDVCGLFCCFVLGTELSLECMSFYDILH